MYHKSREEGYIIQKNPRSLNLYLLPKKHKKGSLDRPIINTIGSISETLSALVDESLKQYFKLVLSYIKDTGHFLQIIKDINVHDEAILCNIDVSALHTNILHREVTKTIKQNLEKQC